MILASPLAPAGDQYVFIAMAASAKAILTHYNFCRVHEALRQTPAMALGLTDHV